MVSGVLLLRSTLQLLPSLVAALGPAEATLLQAVRSTCEHEQLAALLVEVDKVCSGSLTASFAGCNHVSLLEHPNIIQVFVAVLVCTSGRGS